MTTENAIRWLHHQARTCRDLDSSEAFCLLLPALLRVLNLSPMEDVEAAAFRHEFKQRIHALPFQDQADRADQFGGAGTIGGPAAKQGRRIMTPRSPDLPARDMRTVPTV
jgi:hypothetical protein